MAEIDRPSEGPGNNFRGRLLVTLIASAIVISLIMTALIAPAPSEDDPPASNVPARISYIVHSTILINDSADFASQAFNESWLGDGTPGNPYIIADYDIDASSAHGIYIQDTDVHFIVRDCYVHDGGLGYYSIYLFNCMNGTLSNNNCSGSWFGYGIALYASSSNTISNNTCSYNQRGICLSSSSNNTVSNNSCYSNDRDGIFVYYSDSSTVSNNSCYSNDWDGISLNSSSSITVSNNSCSSNTQYGIRLYTSSSNTISNNTCYSNNYYGIFLDSSSSNTLSNNTCSSNDGNGIHLGSSSDNILSNNNCSSNNNIGISIDYSSNNTLSNNVLVDDGIFIDGDSLATFNSHSIDTSNTVNGKPVRYYADQSGITVPAGAGQVILANCNGFVIEDQDLSGGSCGVELAYCSDVTVRNNNCSSNDYFGICLYQSSSNLLSNNTCSSNNYDGIINIGTGICLYSTSDNTLSNNTCSNNGIGIYLLDSGGNTASNNNCSSNEYWGIFLVSSSTNTLIRNQMCDNVGFGLYCLVGAGNTIWNNTFIGNNGAGSVRDPAHIQAYDDGAGNWWNTSGSPHGYGNYWGDWTTPDANFDGIVDKTYNLTAGVGPMDYYPRTTATVIDSLPPATSISLSGTSGLNGWNLSDVNVTLTAIDDRSGVDYTKYRINSGSWQTYAAPFSMSADGTHKVEFYSVDLAGNIESTHSANIKIDKAAPTSAASKSGTTLTLSSSDATSGVNKTFYRINNGSWLTYAAPFNVTASGNNTIEYYSVDEAGNAESAETIYVDNGGGGDLGSIFSQYGIPLIGFIIAIIVAIVVYHVLTRKDKEHD